MFQNEPDIRSAHAPTGNYGMETTKMVVRRPFPVGQVKYIWCLDMVTVLTNEHRVVSRGERPIDRSRAKSGNG